MGRAVVEAREPDLSGHSPTGSSDPFTDQETGGAYPEGIQAAGEAARRAVLHQGPAAGPAPRLDPQGLRSGSARVREVGRGPAAQKAAIRMLLTRENRLNESAGAKPASGLQHRT